MPSKAALCFDVEASSVGNSRQKLGFMFCVLRAWPTLDPRLFAGSVFQKHITEEASVQHASGQMQQGEMTMEMLPPPIEAHRASWEFPKIRGTLSWGPYINKDPTI